MKPASLSLLKREIENLSAKEVQELCLKLAKYKKENKELLSYLIFDAANEAEYIKSVKAEIELQFSEINTTQMYFVRKSVRKILRTTNKFIRYSSQKHTEVELLLFFCSQLKESGIPYQSVTSLNSMFENQLRKIGKAVSTLHEDLQFDYGLEIKQLSE
jgi:membrane-anchored protein YejM (alkaline phosphatase superfamily)